jgi:c-di-GMP-binding flagellar brake protein YcgR
VRNTNVDTEPTIAELRFPQGINLYGTVMQMNAKEISIHLHSVPGMPGLFKKDSGVELAVVARSTMFLAQTQILSESAGRLTLGFSAPVRMIQRRKEKRVPCKMDVNFRPIQENGCVGIWKPGVSSDLSSEGMCLIIEPGLNVPPKMEVMFMLPDPISLPQMPTAAGSDEGIQTQTTGAEQRLNLRRMSTRDRSIRATARVTNQRLRSDKHISLGLFFTTLSPADQIHLVRFLHTPLLPSA